MVQMVPMFGNDRQGIDEKTLQNHIASYSVLSAVLYLNHLPPIEVEVINTSPKVLVKM